MTAAPSAAAGLPPESVVASDSAMWLKITTNRWYASTDWDNPVADSDIDRMLDADEVRVLRIGDGAS
jgi:hypothetical protein